MTNTPLRIGVIGVGFGTRVHVPAFRSEGMEVVAVCARHRERAEEAARELAIPGAYTDYRAMLEEADLDAVSIVTPPAYHHEIATAVMAAGKHVLCEKAFAMNQGEAQEMWRTAQESGVTAMIAHEFRFAPGRAYVKELLEQGYVGDVRTVHMSLFRGPMESQGPRALGWSSQASEGGSFLGALGSHYIDCLRDWFGEIARVSGAVSIQDPERVDPESGKRAQADGDDTFGFLVEFQKGGWASMTASNAAPFGPGARIEIYGTEGTLQTLQPGVNPQADGVVLGARFGDGEGVQELPMPERHRPFDDDRAEMMMAFRILVRRFLRGIAEGTSPAPNFYDGLRCQQVMDAVRSSSTGAGWVELPGE